MDWKDVVGLVAKAAPILGTAIGGPIGAVAGGAISLVASAFGLTDDEAKSPDKVFKAIQGDPQATIKLQELQNRHKERLEELILKRDAVYLADRQSARQREVETTKTTGKRDINLYVLAWTVVVGFFSLTAVLMFIPIESATPVVTMLFGGLVSGFSMVLSYFFGSSKSSSDKTLLLSGKK